MIKVNDTYKCVSSANRVWCGVVTSISHGVAYYITILWRHKDESEEVIYNHTDFTDYMDKGLIWKDRIIEKINLPEELFEL